jgi:hypothetical protein
MKMKITCIGIISSFLIFGCATAKPLPLDISTLNDSVPLTRVRIIVRSDIDVDKKGEHFISKVFPKYIDTIVNSIKETHNIVIDPQSYLEDSSKTESKIDFKVLNFGGTFVVHEYTWEKNSNSSPRSEFFLTFAIRDDGTMPLSVSIKENDPNYEPGKMFSFEIPLKAVEK